MSEGAGFSLLAAACGVALAHTLLGPDHYLPFIMIARARRWSRARALVVTAICGIGHVVSSLALGALGVLAGVAVGSLERIEQGRGSLASWALVAFGLAYAAWGARRAVRRARGLEPHEHDGHVHLHSRGDRPHRHDRSWKGDAGFWALLTVFVLGPCEPLIPLFVLPASRGRWDWAAGAAVVFGVVTVATMVAATSAGLAGLKPLRSRGLERWRHVIAGGMIAASGGAILLFGL